MLTDFPKLVLPCRRCGDPICTANFMCHACGTEMLIDWPKAKVIFPDGKSSAEHGRHEILDAILFTMILREAEEKGKEVAVKLVRSGNCHVKVDGSLVAFSRPSMGPSAIFLFAVCSDAIERWESVSVDPARDPNGDDLYELRLHGPAGEMTDSQQFSEPERLLQEGSFLLAAVRRMLS